MCGITGFLATDRSQSADALRDALVPMVKTIVHRGPDDEGEFVDAGTGVALGFRRLSIIDLSPAGHQPMESATGRFVLIFNGEMYNFQDVREELEKLGVAPSWRGHSDTEVMLAAFETWGIRASVERFNGMFGFAVWDRQEQALTVVRDRAGVKPMYYAWCGKTFLFGSELKALRAHPEFHAEVDRGAVALYARYNYIPAPYSIYSGVKKLPAGAMLTVKGFSPDTKPEHYWNANEVVARAKRDPFRGSREEAVEQLDALLADSVRLRMISDVPLGVFLSGGIDSSTVVALMQANSSNPVKTFSIGFEDEESNEARYAAAVAEHLRTDHTEMYVTSDEARSVIPMLAGMYDEPFADSSQIPTYLVSKLARQKVTVSLSGDGGDELFGGYDRYWLGRRALNRLRRVPAFARPAARRMITSLPAARWDRVLAAVKWAVPEPLSRPRAGERLHKFAHALQRSTPEALYFEIVTVWRDLVRDASEPPVPMTDPTGWPRLEDAAERMMFLDLIGYLPDDILVKVDRASMAVSLEAREPLLDYRVIEFAWKLPVSMKVTDAGGKWILREVLKKYVPPTLFERRKMGFGLPLGDWLRGPLRPWAEDLLSSSRLRADGFLDADKIAEAWAAHLRGEDKQVQLWNVLMFQSWRASSA